MLSSFNVWQDNVRRCFEIEQHAIVTRNSYDRHTSFKWWCIISSEWQPWMFPQRNSFMRLSWTTQFTMWYGIIFYSMEESTKTTQFERIESWSKSFVFYSDSADIIDSRRLNQNDGHYSIRILLRTDQISCDLWRSNLVWPAQQLLSKITARDYNRNKSFLLKSRLMSCDQLQSIMRVINNWRKFCSKSFFVRRATNSFLPMIFYVYK